MELLAGVALFLIVLLVTALLLTALGVFVCLYKILAKIITIDISTGLTVNDQPVDSRDRITPEDSDPGVPLEYFNPKPGVRVKVVTEDEEDQITPLGN